MKILVAAVDTPIGALTLSQGPEGLVGADFDVELPALHARLERRLGPCEVVVASFPAAQAVRRYFEERDLRAIDGLAVTALGTPFQREVWAALRRIPPGTTISYGRLAAELGRPTAVRAVGAANGDNPVAVVVPCHRVIGHHGSLVGYGGGIERKRWLLAHEGALLV
jgi:methylated-DNA-[protein]-cysteine S-methyltransferase